jgi:hypothetical protein
MGKKNVRKINKYFAIPDFIVIWLIPVESADKNSNYKTKGTAGLIRRIVVH